MKLPPFAFLWPSLQCHNNILVSTKLRWALVAFMLATCEIAHSQDVDINRQWTLDLSLGAGYGASPFSAPEGAKLTVFPFFDVNYENGRFFSSLERGVGYNLARTGQFEVDTALSYRFGRSEDLGAHYRGLGNIKGAPLVLVSLAWFPNEILSFYASADRAINGSTGSTLTAGVTVGFPIEGRLNGYVDASGLWGDDDYVKTYYGITPDQAARSRYRAYILEAGLVSTTVSVGFIYEESTKRSVNFLVGATRFEDDAQRSPLTEKRTQPIALFFVTHRW